jgi:hypothetical protein
VEEIARLFGLHKNAVRKNWIKQGLSVIDDRRPMLILGRDLSRFVIKRRQKPKQTCGPGRIYCIARRRCQPGRWQNAPPPVRGQETCATSAPHAPSQSHESRCGEENWRSRSHGQGVQGKPYRADERSRKTSPLAVASAPLYWSIKEGIDHMRLFPRIDPSYRPIPRGEFNRA